METEKPINKKKKRRFKFPKIGYIGKPRIQDERLAEMKIELELEKLKWEDKRFDIPKKEEMETETEFKTSDKEKAILQIPTQDELDLMKKVKVVNTTIKDVEKDDGEANLRGDISSNEVEKAVSVAIHGLIKPENVKHFSDISKHQAYYMSMGYEFCKAIGFESPKGIFDGILDLVISSKRGGRTELKEVGVAGLNREKDLGAWDKFKGIFRGGN